MHPCRRRSEALLPLRPLAMASPNPDPSSIIAFFLLLLLLLLPPAAPFSLDFFPESPSPPRLALSGAASLRPTAVSMASPRARLQLTDPVALGPAFSTYFSFSLPAPGSLAFFLTPAHSRDDHLLLALVFDAAGHVRLDLAGHTAAARAPHLAPAPARLHSWIHYNATSATLQLRLSATSRRPALPLFSLHPLPPSALLLLRTKPMLAGFTSSAANCTLFAWAFRANTYHPMHSQPLDPAHLLTTPPPQRWPRHRTPHYRYPWGWGAALSLLFAAACGAMLTFFILFVCYSLLAAPRPVAPVSPSDSDVVYEKIVLVGVKDDDAATPPAAPAPALPVAGNN